MRRDASLEMTISSEALFTLLEDILPAYIAVVNLLAPSKAVAASGIRRDDLETSTHYTDLHYELVRLQSLLTNFTASESQLDTIRNVLNLFGERLIRSKLVCTCQSGIPYLVLNA